MPLVDAQEGNCALYSGIARRQKKPMELPAIIEDEEGSKSLQATIIFRKTT
jgi:hypothetical protein